MANLLSSHEFWFGAFLLCAFQVAKFSELDEQDEDLKGRYSLLPNLRASDFLGRKQYLATLALFLVVTFIGYLLICLLSPAVIAGWLKVSSGTTDSYEVTKFVESIPYPLYIAAAYMGLAHQGIPGFSRIANYQRNVFHDLVGVPRIVVATSDYFAIQLLARSQTKQALAARLTELSSDQWKARINSYADTNFYNNELCRLQLPDGDGFKEATKESPRELKHLIEQLVYIASIATVRKSGGRALVKLAGDLGVRMPERPTPPMSGILSGVLLSVAALTILWFLIPMVAPLVSRTIYLEFWPQSPGAITKSGMYLLSHVVPMLVAVNVLMMTSLWPAYKSKPDGSQNDDKSVTISGLIERHASLLFGIMILIVIFDYLQTLLDYGTYKPTAVQFFSWLPYHVLHSLISVFVCLFILLHIARWEHSERHAVLIRDWLILVFVVGMVAAFYAEVRLIYQFRKPGAIDFLALVVFLNVAAATIALLTSRSVWRWRLARSHQGEALRLAKEAVVKTPITA